MTDDGSRLKEREKGSPSLEEYKAFNSKGLIWIWACETDIN